MIWTPLAAAYDAEFDALEAARAAYTEAGNRLLEELRAAWVAALGPELGLTASTRESDRAEFKFIRGEVLRDGACLGLWAWLGAPWGAPPGTVRMALYVAEAPGSEASAHRDELIRKGLATLAEPLPGSPHDPVRDFDARGAPLRVDTIRIPQPFDRGAFREAAVRQARALLQEVGLPVAARFSGPLEAARGLLGSVVPLLEALPLERGDWDVQPLVSWGAKGGQVVGIENDHQAIYLGVDPTLRRLYLNTRANDAILHALARERSAILQKSPYLATDETMWLGSIDEPLPTPESLAAIYQHWMV